MQNDIVISIQCEGMVNIELSIPTANTGKADTLGDIIELLKYLDALRKKGIQ